MSAGRKPAVYLRLRCPICGKNSFPKNFKRDHQLAAWIQEFKGNKGITWTPQETVGPDSLQDFWIRHLANRLQVIGQGSKTPWQLARMPTRVEPPPTAEEVNEIWEKKQLMTKARFKIL